MLIGAHAGLCRCVLPVAAWIALDSSVGGCGCETGHICVHLYDVECVRPGGCACRADSGWRVLVFVPTTQSVKRKSGRQALCCGGKKVYGCSETALGTGGQ